MKTFTFVGSEMSSKNSAVKQLVQLWCCFVFSSSGASDSCRSNGMFPHPSECGKFFSCTPWGPVLMHCPAGLHFNPQLHICDWPNRAGCMDKQHSTQKCPIYRHPTDCAKFYICAPPGHLLLHCPFAAVTEESKEETTALPQTDASNEGTNAVTEEWKEETTHEPLLSTTEASAENPNLTTEVQKFSTAVTEESKEETTASIQPEVFSEVVWATTNAANETTAVTEEWKEETTQQLLNATEFSTTTDEETEEPNVGTTRSSEAHTGTSTWNQPSTEAEASLVTTERAPSSASGEAAMFTIEPASTAVDAEAATTEIVSPTTTA
ncbi:hypothetical protein HUJ05_007238 [Dendroctonus ponderosae]|nr:hypothetical protein HUJ05_007238 [Dendroctonus ponderosae]